MYTDNFLAATIHKSGHDPTPSPFFGYTSLKRVWGTYGIVVPAVPFPYNPILTNIEFAEKVFSQVLMSKVVYHACLF
jgi:hypothetical protein